MENAPSAGAGILDAVSSDPVLRMSSLVAAFRWGADGVIHDPLGQQYQQVG